MELSPNTFNVHIAAGGQHPTSDEDWWLHMYVMLSRATSLSDVLLVCAPEASFLLKGPPPNLRKRIEIFRRRVDMCRHSALNLARELGFEEFLH